MGGSKQKFIKEMVKVGMEQPNCYESKEQLRNELVGTWHSYSTGKLVRPPTRTYAHLQCKCADGTSIQDPNEDSSQSETKSDPNSKEKQ